MKVTDKEKEDLYEESLERNRRWTDKAMSQLSFLNSLLLTLGLAFITLSFEKLKSVDLRFDIHNYDKDLTLYVSSFILIGVSVFIGLLVAHNRTINFRITRHINQTRHRALKYSGHILDASTAETYKGRKRFWLQFKHIKEFLKILIEDCMVLNDDENTKNEVYNKFRELRVIGHNLGYSTWIRTNWQIGIFSFGVILYFVATLI